MKFYAIYKGKNKIVKREGNPRSKENQKGMVVWHENKAKVQKWARQYGTKSQKETISKTKSKPRPKQTSGFGFNFSGFGMGKSESVGFRQPRIRLGRY